MEFSASQIATFINGEIIGDPNVMVNDLSRIEDGMPNTLTFLANPQYEEHIYNTNASVVLVNRDFEGRQQIRPTLIKVDDARMAFATLLNTYNGKNDNKLGIQPQSHISATATIGKNVFIGAFTYIGENAVVGDNTKIFPGCYIGDNTLIGHDTTLFAGVKVYEKCKVGNHCTLHSNVVIGADGFGFAQKPGKENIKIHQIGNVVIEDEVEIGANSSIDAATVGSTIIRKGVKLDNLIQIAHNVEIGEYTVIAAQTGIAGSTKIGKRCMIGGQVGIVGHLTIADGTLIAAQSGIQKSILKPGTAVQGSPAFEVETYRRAYIGFKNLPDILKKIANLEAEIGNLKKAQDQDE